MVSGSASYTYLYDGNGNVGQMVNSSTGVTEARYEYDPYGNEIVATGALAQSNPYRFSTKYFDTDSGLYYYGYRYYDPETGRWLNRDPAATGINFYIYVLNDSINLIDYLGLDAIGPIGNPDTWKKNEEELKRRKLIAALSFDVTVALSATATYEGVIRSLYVISEQKLKTGYIKLAELGVLSWDEALVQYDIERTKLLRQMRGRSSPIGRYVAQAIKPEGKLPTVKELISRKGSAENVLRTAKSNKRINQKVFKSAKAGSVCLLISLSITAGNIITAEEGQRIEVAVKEAGGWSGAIAGAWAFGEVFGKAGTAYGGEKVGAASAFFGTVIGSYFGANAFEFAAEMMYDAVVSE